MAARPGESSDEYFARKRNENNTRSRKYYYESREQNIERVKKYLRKMKDDPEYRAKRSRRHAKWRLANLGKTRLASRNSYYTYHDRYREKAKEWIQDNRGKFAALVSRHRAKKNHAPGCHSARDVVVIWYRQRRKCAVPNCMHPISWCNKHVDHIWPLAAGFGCDCPRGLQILCRFHNDQKQDRDPNEWGKQYGLKYYRHKIHVS